MAFRPRIFEAAKEAVAVARGEQPAARIHVAGHAYVPAADYATLESENAELRAKLEEALTPERLHGAIVAASRECYIEKLAMNFSTVNSREVLARHLRAAALFNRGTETE